MCMWIDGWLKNGVDRSISMDLQGIWLIKKYDFVINLLFEIIDSVFDIYTGDEHMIRHLKE